ncbi:hypothetical protein LIX92_03100 [Faecalibacillus faecis]|jgi:hypothetical protein|uniref:hypothetical protein n=1 Tax=Faecalibacillus faecis TaxID=1982628 RepID=UPI00204C14E6|nr:hypothetical protein [Faecalibacillus faecis]DAP55883.1 MAG TPA: hypothetical protein [Caudoviricetes sp.]DAT82565.1 MAG TPA: hypothetical protein [Caudoviricetes sp.]
MSAFYFVQAFTTLKDMDESGVETLSYGKEQACNSLKDTDRRNKNEKRIRKIIIP